MRKPCYCLDAGLFIALTAPNRCPPELIASVKGLLAEFDSGASTALASVLIVTELLDGSLAVLERAFDNRKGAFVDVDPSIAHLARRVRNKILRHDKPLDTPDCIYIATAITYKCDALVTIDGLSITASGASVSPKHKLLSAAPEIQKDFNLRVCSPMEIVDQPLLDLGSG